MGYVNNIPIRTNDPAYPWWIDIIVQEEAEGLRTRRILRNVSHEIFFIDEKFERWATFFKSVDATWQDEK